MAASAVIIYTCLGGIQNENQKVVDLSLASLLALKASLTGCKKGEEGTANAYVKQFLNISMFDQRTLDINDAEDSNSAQVLTETMEGLTRVYSD